MSYFGIGPVFKFIWRDSIFKSVFNICIYVYSNYKNKKTIILIYLFTVLDRENS